MRIIAFVGSPVEDNEKDVSLKPFRLPFCSNNRNIFLLIIHLFNTFSPCPCPSQCVLSPSQPATVPPADSAACQAGKALEKRESECGYYQLWRRGEDFLVYLPIRCYKAEHDYSNF